MEDESRRQVDTDEDKGYAGIHSKYWQLTSIFFFLLGMTVTVMLVNCMLVHVLEVNTNVPKHSKIVSIPVYQPLSRRGLLRC